ncbi:MAG TPA: NrtA/SsuA/CpmA family ABC transporter substrate-binding protein [Chloroflexota bacterium]|nr:NrtA/SsuA/CpmA family ABC transporter substrate-binding protein [Chloroflexota bacterium]
MRQGKGRPGLVARVVGTWAAVGLGLGCAGLLACNAASGPPPAAADARATATSTTPARVTVRWAAISANPNNWPVYAAQSQGFFEEMGIDLDLAYTDASTRAVQVLASRDADITSVAADTAIEAIERGAPFVMVGGSTRVPVYTLVARPEIHSYADLRGKLVAVTGANVAEGPLLRKLLAKYGLSDSDYETIAVGGPVQRYAAVQSGAVAASMVPQPFDFRGADEGLVVLGYSTEVLPDYQFIGYTARRDWTREQPEVVVRLLRALRKADRWLYDPAHAAAAARLYAEASHENEEYARRTYDLIYQQLKVMAPDATISLTGLQAVLDLMAEQGRLNLPLPSPTKYVDTSFIEAAARAEAAGS